MDLDAQDASEVLAHDELAIGHPGRESQVLTWFKEWVAYKIERYARARKVWEAVRFELLSVQELLRLGGCRGGKPRALPWEGGPPLVSLICQQP